MFACNFAPTGFLTCDGQLVPVRAYPALASVIGKTFGGNGTTTVQLPALGGVAPIGSGQGSGLSPRVIGETGGEPTVLISSTDQLAMHSHGLAAVQKPTATTPVANVFSTRTGQRPEPNFYVSNPPQSSLVSMVAGAIASVGGTPIPHNNIQPYQVLNFCIAAQGDTP